MGRWKIVIPLLLILVVIGVLAALPTTLRAVPSRYIAAASNSLPEPLQEPFNQLAVPQQQVAILPTAVPVANVDSLLGKPDVAAEDRQVSDQLPPTFTPEPGSADPALPTSLPTTIPATFTPVPSPTPSPTPVPVPRSVRLEGFDHQFQQWNNCGPATLAMTLSYFDLHLVQSQTASVLKPNAEDRNVSPYEMVDFVRNETQFDAIYRANGDINTIKRLLANNIPVILEIGIEPPGDLRWMGWYGHYMLLVAYDDAQQQLWVYDSWLGTSAVPLSNADRNGRVLTYRDLARDWPHFNRNYIAVFQPEQAALVSEIIGPEMNDTVMWQGAVDQAQQDARSDPQNPFFWFNLGTSLNSVGEYEAAAQAFDQARAIGLPWRMLWYQFGPFEAYYQTGRYDDVILLADTTLKDRPYFEESFYYKGLALEAVGEINEARQNFEKAANFNPNFAPALASLALIENGG